MHDQLRALNHQFYGPYNIAKHIGEVLDTIRKERPTDPLEVLEEMSTLLWQERHIGPPPTLPSVPDDEIDRCNATLALLEKLDSDAVPKVTDTFFEFQAKWEEVGITLDDDFALLLQCSLIKLAEDCRIIGVRFWGTLNTPSGAVYVAEADIPLEFREGDAPVVGPYDVPVEAGVGVNRFVYYATKSPFDDWHRLPDLRPTDISQSRDVVWQLTGDLSAGIRAFQGFRATEEVYLRALIARISSATILAPQGYIKMWEPEEEEKHEEPPEEEEEAKEPPPKQLKLIIDPDFEPIEDVSSIEWVHVRPFILPQGRETYKKAPKPPKEAKPEKKKAREAEEEDEEEKQEEPEDEHAEEEEDAPEEGVELFGGSGEDEPIRLGGEEELPCWQTKTVTSPIEGRGFQLIESVRWPGAFNLSDGRRSCSLYYGMGNKFVVNGFQPPKPPPIAKEYRRKMSERADPTVDDEKEVEKAKHPPEEEEDEGR
jgi:hypothetical protein